MKRFVLFSIAVCAIAAVLALLPDRGEAAPQPLETNERPRAVRRGEFLVHVASCGDCHTPLKMGQNGPEPDMTRMLSGHPEGLKMPAPPKPVGPWMWFGAATNTAFAGPWGVSYAINLTPDPNTGLGVWTEEMFVKALKTGKHFGTARPILPPMPWQNYSTLAEADLKAIYAYLKTIPPVTNHVPDAVEAPPPAPPAKPSKATKPSGK